MRESFASRLSTTLKGKLFAGALKQFETPRSPFRFRLLAQLPDRLSAQEIASHRAAIWLPLDYGSEPAFSEMVQMGLPVFVPVPALQASVSAIRMDELGCDRDAFCP
eukprot:gnl/TRDRNA2_/TRDRNA2_167861_c0_seq1.p2 gnl/TRDRNA2_/TRDRNA2_167861_c0~~gnl/TRDRNA2_/TRDRNA2_167861_c0_seq1.p2  ORF type:complete len:107 (+),score=16.02 gnl/TRDRNA2_/TRDRNA2_167861_c0_seq1:107-427(+)